MIRLPPCSTRTDTLVPDTTHVRALRQIRVQSKRAGDGPGDLRDLKAVREAHAEVIAVGCDEHLRLVPQTAEGDGMDDAVAVALKGVARPDRKSTRLNSSH